MTLVFNKEGDLTMVLGSPVMGFIVTFIMAMSVGKDY